MNIINIKSNDYVIDILNYMLINNIDSNFILHGMHGTGKTSLVKSFSKDYNNNKILEINNINNRGYDSIKKIINNYMKTNNLFSKKKKIILFDNIDNISLDIQKMLLYLIEKYKKNILFIFTCNHINKIYNGIKTKCIIFKLNKIFLTDFNILLNKECTYNNKIIKDLYNKTKGNIEISKILLENNKEPENIDNIINIFFTKDDIKKKYNDISIIIKDKDITLQILIKTLTKICIEKHLYDKILKISRIERNIMNDYSEKLQLYCLISLLHWTK